MITFLEPNLQNVLLCSLVFIVSGIIILKTMKKFNMHLASKLFAALFSIVGIYIPFYFLGTLMMHLIPSYNGSAFCMLFIKQQLQTLNAPFFLFESASFLVVLIALFAVIALIIAAVFIVKTVAKLFKAYGRWAHHGSRKKNSCTVYYSYIPNHQDSFLIFRRLLN